jgi:hypothetical protein
MTPPPHNKHVESSTATGIHGIAKEFKDGRAKAAKEANEAKGPKEPKEAKESKESSEPKEGEEGKVPNHAEEAAEANRKALAAEQELRQRKQAGPPVDGEKIEAPKVPTKELQK